MPSMFVMHNSSKCGQEEASCIELPIPTPTCVPSPQKQGHLLASQDHFDRHYRETKQYSSALTSTLLRQVMPTADGVTYNHHEAPRAV